MKATGHAEDAVRKTASPPHTPNSSRDSRLEKNTRPLSALSNSSTSHSSHSSPATPLFFGDYLFPENPAMLDLLQVYQLDKSSKQKDYRQSLQLHAHLMGLALATRVSSGLDLAYDHIHDAFKNNQRPDRRGEFVAAFNFAYEETERILQFALAQPHPRPSFLDMLSQSSSSAILTFLHRLRTDHSILANAFRNLQSQELDMLLVPDRTTVPSHASGARGLRDRGYSAQFTSSGHAAPSPISQQQHSGHLHSSNQQAQQQKQQQQQPHSTVPNFVNNQDVIHIILNNLFGLSSFAREETLRACAVKSILVGLITDKKGERLMIEMLERYVSQSQWRQSNRAKAAFEAVLLDIVQRGDTALAGSQDEELSAHVFPPNQQLQHHNLNQQYHQGNNPPLGKMASIPSMRLDYSESPTGHGSRTILGPKNTCEHPGMFDQKPVLTTRQDIVEGFFVEACLDILNILDEFSPPCLFELSQMLSRDLDERTRPYASLVIIVKFFFYRFMNKCITYPETYGMMQDTFLSERQRQRILFTLHQRLYRYVTSILSPAPGWESRSPVLDPRIRAKVELFISRFSLGQDGPKKTSESSTPSLFPIAESLAPLPPKRHVAQDANGTIRTTSVGKGTSTPHITPFLLLNPSDFTTLFYFVCPNLRTVERTPKGASSVLMTRSSSFSGKGAVSSTRQRTSSETPPTYPAALKAASQAALSNLSGSTGSTGSGGTPPKATQNATSTRTHKRSSPSFSFFAGASSMPFKAAKPPPPITVEKAPLVMAATTEATTNGAPFMALSGIKSGLTTSPHIAAVEVTSSISSIGPTLSSSPKTTTITLQDCRSQSSSAPPAVEEPPAIKHWSDFELLPALQVAISDIKNFQPGPIKEAPQVLNQPSLGPLREAWALAYVQYGEAKKSLSTDGVTETVQEKVNGRDALDEEPELVEVGLTLAPSCMAMVMENVAYGSSRIVTVTKPMLVDQVMDSAGGRSEFELGTVDLGVEETDTDSVMSSEDISLEHGSQQLLSPEDKELSILRVNSSQMLSSMDDSGTKNIPMSGQLGQLQSETTSMRMTTSTARASATSSHLSSNGSCSSRHTNHLGRSRDEYHANAMLKKTAADRAWKARIRETVHSEQDLPEEIRTVARSIFKILREFDITSTGLYGDETFDDGHCVVRSLLLEGIQQAQLFGNHASAIGFHHSLRVLETAPIFRQLDSSKLIYLLAMPIKHRLEHRAGRARVRILWESYAHSWHARVVAAIDRKRENLSSLRIKMYYQTCVRPSRAFEKSMGVVGVLSRLNKAVLRKYSAMDEWEAMQALDDTAKDAVAGAKSSGISFKLGSATCDVSGCQNSACLDHHLHQSASGGSATDTASRRLSANSATQSHASRVSKIRRSSFSAYIDNMTSRSFGAHTLLENGLGNLKEKEQAFFVNGAHPSHAGSSFWSHSNGSLIGSGTGAGKGSGLGLGSGSMGSLADAAEIPSDFVMDAREVEAVQRWIEAAGIHNFLPGEDNFLRFCMEVESVVRGVGLGGTGIQGAGIPQAQNGTITPGLHSSGSDFFVKEVAKFNGQFVPGMGPPNPATTTTTQTKTASAAGVAEFLVNSFKNSHAGTSAPMTSGSHFFSNSGSSSQSQGGSLGSLGQYGQQRSTYGLQSSQDSVGSNNNNSSANARSRLQQRQAQNRPQGSHLDALPDLLDNPYSMYASQPGPTYALYNPPYATASSASSSSYAGSSPGGMSTTVAPHHTSLLSKDMPEFLRRVQLKLTSFVLSEWLDIFGEVEADRWLLEFIEELSGGFSSSSTSEDKSGQRSKESEKSSMLRTSEDMNHDGDILPENAMDLGEKCISMPSENKPNCHNNSNGERASHAALSDSSLHIIGAGDRADSLTSWSSQNSTHGLLSSSSVSEVEDSHADVKDTIPVGSLPSATSFISSNKSLRSFPSMNSLASVLDTSKESRPQPPLPPPSTSPLLPMASSVESKGTSERGLLNIQISGIQEKIQRQRSFEQGPTTTAPYNLIDAYRSTIEQFNQTKSPYQKLGHLFSLELLIVASLSYPDSCADPSMSLPGAGAGRQHLRSTSRPKISEEGATSSNVEGRLAPGEPPMSPRAITPGTDAIVDEIEHLFRMPGGLRPRHLLRDMQLIAIFIPGSILDLRDDGKAFWDMALAVTSVKTDVVEYIVQKGTRYIEMDSDEGVSGGSGGSSGLGNGLSTGTGTGTNVRQDTARSGSRTIMQDDEERMRMSEAVRLFTIGAKESHRVAQRELAILYMSLPMLPASSSPTIGYPRDDGSTLLSNSRVPSPVSFTSSKYGGRVSGARATPPPSPKGTLSTAMFGSSFKSGSGLGSGAPSGGTASIPIKQTKASSSRHQHSSSGGSGSSFGSGMLSGLGIMTGLGSFTGASSTGSATMMTATTTTTATATTKTHDPYGSNSSGGGLVAGASGSTLSLHQQCGEFAEGHDIEQYLDMHTTRTSASIASYQSGSSSLHPHHQHNQHQQQQRRQQQQYQTSSTSSGPDKFNPENVAAAMHWFSLAAAQGDQFSINYLKHKEASGGIVG
ncbi:hypothetical protein BGZ94_003420 [Podila epigama]|nr:hypothetical protein BGZ94_003420 [Podila epigama]